MPALSNKHSSLVRISVNHGQKSFITLAPVYYFNQNSCSLSLSLLLLFVSTKRRREGDKAQQSYGPQSSSAVGDDGESLARYETHLEEYACIGDDIFVNSVNI